MGKLEKCLYIVELLSRGKPLSLKEINEHWQYSSLYDNEIIPKTFGRYKEYISDVLPLISNTMCVPRSITSPTLTISRITPFTNTYFQLSMCKGLRNLP